MCTLVVWSLTPLGTSGRVSAGVICLFDGRAGLGLSPVSHPSSCSDVAVLSGGDLHQGFVAGKASKRGLPCIVSLVGDAGVLCPLWLLGDLRNGGEVLSPNAFALCTIYFEACYVVLRVPSPGYGVPLKLKALPIGLALLTHSWFLFSRPAYRSLKIRLSSLSSSISSLYLFRIVYLVFMSYYATHVFADTHSFVPLFLVLEEEDTPRWSTYLPVVDVGRTRIVGRASCPMSITPS